VARLAYLGTPELAVPPLLALLEAGHEIVEVVTRPDRRRGRGSGLSPSPVKAAALDLDLPVTDQLTRVLDAGAELGVVVAYGRLVPAPVLAGLAMVNLHFSLLPRWRGAAPVERAILAGDEATGVCVMALEEALDTGPVFRRQAVAVGPDEHLGPLRQRLVAVGSELLVEVLAGGVGGLPVPEPQVGEPTYAAKLTPDELELHFSEPAVRLARVVRLDGAYTEVDGRRLRVLEAEVGDEPDPEVPPGTLVADRVATGAGWLRLVRVQPAGKAPMAADAWLRGARPRPGTRLGTGDR